MFAFFLFLSRKFRFARRRLGVRVSEFNPCLLYTSKLGYNRMKVETQRLDADGKPMVDDNGNNIMDSEGVWFKNQDEFVVSVAPSFKMSENWSYGSILNFRSQFVNGYKSRTEQKLSLIHIYRSCYPLIINKVTHSLLSV